MFTFGTASPKKWVRDPLALFSVSRSSSRTGIWHISNHSASPVMTLVLPTPPLPPIVRITLFLETLGSSVLTRSGSLMDASLKGLAPVGFIHSPCRTPRVACSCSTETADKLEENAGCQKAQLLVLRMPGHLDLSGAGFALRYSRVMAGSEIWHPTRISAAD